MSIVTVLGAGMMGSALCVPFADRGHDVRLVGTHLDRDIIDCIRSDGSHPKLKLRLPRAIHPFQLEGLGEAMEGSRLLVLGVSSAGVRWAAKTIGQHMRPDLPILSVTKGLEWDGRELVILPDVLAEHLPFEALEIAPAAVAGPCIAGELARRAESCVVFTSRTSQALTRVVGSTKTPYYHITLSDDAVGVEACAALKNAYAMAIAFADGVNEKRGGASGSVALHNYEAAVYTQALGEIAQLVQVMGGRPETAYGLAGAGDLLVTTNGGRTGRFGRWLGLGLTVAEAIERMEGATLECLDIIATVARALPYLERHNAVKPLDLPLMRHMIDVVQNGAEVDMPFGAFGF